MDPLKDLRRLEQEIQRQLPRLAHDMAEHAQAFFEESFDRQGFTDKSTEKWEPRKSKGHSKFAHEPILERSGRLRNSFRIIRQGAATFTLVNDAPYAKYLNEGTADMPARPFMGDSHRLQQELKALVIKKIMDK